MKKKTIITSSIIILLAVTFITADIIIGNNEPADFVVGDITEKTDVNFTYYVNEKDYTGNCPINKIDTIDNEFESCLKELYPNLRVNNIVDGLGRTYQQKLVNGTIHRSFDESKLDALSP